jgi:predicted glutamine amidotransferase
MCQLLGISANREVDIRFSFREWRHRGNKNPHGYGFAHWKGGQLTIVKAASNLYEQKPEETEDILAAHSRLFLAHVRFATVGARDGRNTHPFMARAVGRSFAFAHNGTVSEVKKRELRQTPGGDTDSEHALLFLLEGLADSPEEAFASRLKELADEIRALGRFNFLLSDGRHLWAYADNSLYFIERKPPYGGELVRLVDNGYSISLAEVKRGDEQAVLVATRPLTDETGWQQLAAGELLVVRDGLVETRLDG